MGSPVCLILVTPDSYVAIATRPAEPCLKTCYHEEEHLVHFEGNREAITPHKIDCVSETVRWEGSERRADQDPWLKRRGTEVWTGPARRSSHVQRRNPLGLSF